MSYFKYWRDNINLFSFVSYEMYFMLDILRIRYSASQHPIMVRLGNISSMNGMLGVHLGTTSWHHPTSGHLSCRVINLEYLSPHVIVWELCNMVTVCQSVTLHTYLTRSDHLILSLASWQKLSSLKLGRFITVNLDLFLTSCKLAQETVLLSNVWPSPRSPSPFPWLRFR